MSKTTYVEPAREAEEMTIDCQGGSRFVELDAQRWGKISPERKAALDEHIETCPDCRDPHYRVHGYFPDLGQASAKEG